MNIIADVTDGNERIETMELQIINNQIVANEIAHELTLILEQKEKLEAREKEIKEALLAAMEDNGIIKASLGNCDITYIAPTKRESFDSKRLRKDNPDLYDEYVNITDVKASICIKLIGGANDN